MSGIRVREPGAATRVRWTSLLWYEAPLLACMVVITTLSTRPVLPGPGDMGSLLRDLFNYGNHVFFYATLATLAWRVLVYRARSLPSWLIAHPRVTAPLFATLYGIGDELLQAFVPGRTTSAVDALANGLGAVLAMLVIGLWQRWTARAQS